MELEMVRFTILPPETQITEKMNLNLHGKTAIVCGSTQGIGRAIAIELASLGANIVLFARNAEAMAGSSTLFQCLFERLSQALVYQTQ
jgi:NAD(P)-dependent dehydrogenase (short-subunit alcohol dehydrogenase family)